MTSRTSQDKSKENIIWYMLCASRIRNHPSDKFSRNIRSQTKESREKESSSITSLVKATFGQAVSSSPAIFPTSDCLLLKATLKSTILRSASRSRATRTERSFTTEKSLPSAGSRARSNNRTMTRFRAWIPTSSQINWIVSFPITISPSTSTATSSSSTLKVGPSPELSSLIYTIES